MCPVSLGQRRWSRSVVYHTPVSGLAVWNEERSLTLVETAYGFGLAGEFPLATIEAAAMAAERAGYHTFWLSQPARGDSLSTLARIARRTSTLMLGVGAIPLTLQSADEIVRRVGDLAVPLERLRLGVGSGTGDGALARLRDGVQTLRERLDIEIVVAPLGPKMCRLAGEVADTVLLNWLTPAYATTSNGWIEKGAAASGRNMPTVCAYVRCALGRASTARLDAECARYAAFPHYAAHFRRQGVAPVETTILATIATEIQERLASYTAVLDHVVVRAITPDDAIEDVLTLLEAAKPSL